MLFPLLFICLFFLPITLLVTSQCGEGEMDGRPSTTCNHQILVLIGRFSIFGRKHVASSSFLFFVTVNEADLVRVRRAKTVSVK